jgi:hypothetical protein
VIASDWRPPCSRSPGACSSSSPSSARRCGANLQRRLLHRLPVSALRRCRLARFNVQVNPIPKNPAAPTAVLRRTPHSCRRRHVAAVVWANDSQPLVVAPLGGLA